MKIFVVHSTKSNFFMKDLCMRLVENLKCLGFDTELSIDHFPQIHGARYIFLPHEYNPESIQGRFPNRFILARSIALISENPGSEWFEYSKSFAPLFSKFIFINKSSMDVFPTPPQTKLYFQLFNSSAEILFDDFSTWDTREFDITFIGGEDKHRKRILASHSLQLSNLKSFLCLAKTPSQTNEVPDSSQLSSSSVRELMHSSRVLLNIHRQGTRSFEWARMLTSMEEGSVVLSENSIDSKSLIPHQHFIPLDETTDIQSLFSDSRKLYEIALNSFQKSKDLRCENSIEEITRFLEKAFSIKRYLFPSLLRNPRKIFDFFVKSIVSFILTNLNQLIINNKDVKYLGFMVQHFKRTQKSLFLQNLELQRKIDFLLCEPKVQDDARYRPLIDTRTRNHYDFSIAIPFYREQETILRCLRSVQAIRTSHSFEVIMCSDMGDERTIKLAKDFLSESLLPYSIIIRNSNGGVGAARNDLLEVSKSNRVIMLDGDNELLPNGANLLLDALKPESKAAFAYGFLAVEENGVMLDIMSFLPWDAQLFSKLGNYIDALAIVDREIVIAHGGYAESLTLYGWEDFDLWARLAEGKYTAAGVRNFVGKYHRNPVSMISATNIDTSDALATIKSRAPSLFL